MKIQCDVCNKDKASVFYTADEVALCDACDHRVHHANKLASKHQCFSLLRPSTKQYPPYNVCQERRAFMYCRQDRAILCKECDLPIHSVNEYTQKHNRFFLTGVKLSAVTKIYSSANSNTLLTSDFGSMSNSKSRSSIVKNYDTSSCSNLSHLPLISKTAPSAAAVTPPNPMINKVGESLVGIELAGSTSTSSISEYLIKTLPGWQVEDFLDSSSVPFVFSKGVDMLPVLDADIEGKMVSFSMESMGI